MSISPVKKKKNLFTLFHFTVQELQNVQFKKKKKKSRKQPITLKYTPMHLKIEAVHLGETSIIGAATSTTFMQLMKSLHVPQRGG